MKKDKERQWKKRHQVYKFAVGDLILHDCHTLGNASKIIANELLLQHSGLFIIAVKVEPNVYKFMDFQIRRRYRKVNAD